MKNYFFTIMAATAMLASCSQDAELNEIIDNQPKAITEIGATTSAETRAVVSSSDQTKVNWETGDQLGAFGEGVSGVVAYTLNGAGGSTSGTFKNAESTITAVQAMMYPCQSTATWNNTNSKLTCEIPTVQTATAGSFDKATAIMYHFGSETNPTLNYAVAFLKVNIPSGTTNVHAITVYSSTALSGKVDITSTGVAAASEGSQTYVTLQADASNGALADGKDYYIAVKLGTLADLSIAYKYTDHTAKAKQGGSSLTLEAGHVKAISANFTTGTVREAKQLWENGPYFATENAGIMTWPDGMAAWGSAWTIASENDLTNLYTDSYARKLWTLENSAWGFKFIGIAEGYISNSIFFPPVNGDEVSGSVGYWSSSENGTDEARYVNLGFSNGRFVSYWHSGDRTRSYRVRCVLR